MIRRRRLPRLHLLEMRAPMVLRHRPPRLRLLEVRPDDLRHRAYRFPPQHIRGPRTSSLQNENHQVNSGGDTPKDFHLIAPGAPLKTKFSAAPQPLGIFA